MGTLRFAWSGGSNTAPYDTIAKAATNPATIMALTADGDENRYAGTFTLAASLNPTGIGTAAGGGIQHNGCNTSGVVDGTMVVFDGDSAASNVISAAAGKNHHLFKYIEMKNAVNDGANATGVLYSWKIDSCYIHNCGGSGMQSTNFNYASYKDSRFNDNAVTGLSVNNNSSSIGCIANGNGTSGMVVNSRAAYGCIAHNNGTNNFHVNNATLVNCVADGWTGAAVGGNGIIAQGVGGHLFGCRITNCTAAINIAAGIVFYAYCGFYGNTGKFAGAGATSYRDLGGSVDMAADGYVGGLGGGATDNFNLKNGATPAELRWTEDDIDGTNKFYIFAGLGPNPDFPSAANTMPADSTDGVTGTNDKLYSAAEETSRNTDPGVAKVEEDVTYKIYNVDLVGTLVTTTIADAPTELESEDVLSTSFRVRWNNAARADEFKVYVDGVLNDTVTVNYKDFTGMTAGTAYSITVISSNAVGDSAASEALVVTTDDPTSRSVNDLGATALGSAVSFGGAVELAPDQTGRFFAFRGYSSALTLAEFEFFYLNVVENNGKAVLRPN